MSEETKLHEVAVAWRPEKGDAVDQITREVRAALDLHPEGSCEVRVKHSTVFIDIDADCHINFDRLDALRRLFGTRAVVAWLYAVPWPEGTPAEGEDPSDPDKDERDPDKDERVGFRVEGADLSPWDPAEEHARGRSLMRQHAELRRRLDDLEKKMVAHDMRVELLGRTGLYPGEGMPALRSELKDLRREVMRLSPADVVRLAERGADRLTPGEEPTREAEAIRHAARQWLGGLIVEGVDPNEPRGGA